jgi:hypothetical protein
MRRIVVVTLMLGFSPAVFAHDLAGTWIFEKEINTTADGKVVAVPGPDYEGRIIYTADGHVSATLMPRGRAFTANDGAATAYAGHYAVDEKAHTVTHVPVTSIDPAEVGKSLVRHWERRGDLLLLSGQWNYQGQALTFTVQWRRAPAAR